MEKEGVPKNIEEAIKRVENQYDIEIERNEELRIEVADEVRETIEDILGEIETGGLRISEENYPITLITKEENSKYSPKENIIIINFEASDPKADIAEESSHFLRWKLKDDGEYINDQPEEPINDEIDEFFGALGRVILGFEMNYKELKRSARLVDRMKGFRRQIKKRLKRIRKETGDQSFEELIKEGELVVKEKEIDKWLNHWGGYSLAFLLGKEFLEKNRDLYLLSDEEVEKKMAKELSNWLRVKGKIKKKIKELERRLGKKGGPIGTIGRFLGKIT